MFSSALKSFSSNITSNYSISQTVSATSGPWKIYNAKKKSGGKLVSVFVFERKALEPPSGGYGGKSGAASLKRYHDEVVDRLKKEASSLARLRHPSILELAEPVEETRNGGLMFATEPVTASLAGLLEEKDSQDSTRGSGGRKSRFVVEDDGGGSRRRREVEIDELEIQKGLLQVGKGLEFLHESAGLVHGNLTPEAIFVNAKSDWKISGLGFSTPPANSSGTAAAPSIALSEVLSYDPRLPRSVQLELDYTSPDFVLDNNINTLTDMFSLGLVIIALYNTPHKSPLDTNQSISNYKRIFASPASIPTHNNNFLVRQELPRDIKAEVLPRLITRRPAQRLSAREFQQARYFDNILVSTIRFLDSLPAKSPNEKSQFLRGLPRILSQFPKSVLEKKVLPALLDETKDQELLSLILQNVFKVLEQVPNSRRVFEERVLPCLRTMFAISRPAKGKEPERDTRKEAGLLVILENMSTITQNCSGQEFKEDMMPIVNMALESPTASVIDKALQQLDLILKVLDFSTIKNDLFPIVAQVFSKTSSMAIKIRSLQSLGLLCGASSEELPEDLSSIMEPSKTTANSSAILDKYTIQEKVVPLLRGIKTKEPAVMMAALNVFKQVGKVCDSDFIALEVIPVLWAFSLGPLLNLKQFQAYMALTKHLSARIESEQTRKLSELSYNNNAHLASSAAIGGRTNGNANNLADGGEADFESLVTGRKADSGAEDMLDAGWGSEASLRPAPRASQTRQASSEAMFTWSTPAPTPAASTNNHAASLQPLQASTISRTITPDLSSFAALTPSNPATSNPWSQTLQPQSSSQTASPLSPQPKQLSGGPSSINWSTASSTTNNISWNQPHATPTSTVSNGGMGAGSFGATTRAPSNAFPAFSIPPPPTSASNRLAQGAPQATPATARTQLPKQGLEKYESLI